MNNELTIGPKFGVLSLQTGREGVVSKAGHDLTLTIEDWTAVVAYDGALGFEHLRFVAQVNSLMVASGDGGLKPLTEKDKSTIRKQALKTMLASTHPEVIYETSNVIAQQGGFALTGMVEIAGHEEPLNVAVAIATTDSSRITAQTSVIQSAFGIKPYAGMLGALRVRDRVDITLDLTVRDLSELADPRPRSGC